MSDSIDRVFAHALNTVKKIPRMGSARPPPAQRLRLYGLYKQSMEGDVDHVMDRPFGDDDEVRSDQEKWDAWYQQRGMSSTEAKRAYITTLIDTMRRYASSTPDARELVADLEFVWDQIKSNPPSSSSSQSFPRVQTSQKSPSPTQRRVIYPVMSGDGAHLVTHHPHNHPIRVLSPTSEPLEDDVGQGADETEEEELGHEARERFVDAKDSHIADEEEIQPSHSSDSEPSKKPKSRDKGGGTDSGGATGIIAPLVKYIQGGAGLSAEEKWHKRIESALIKMNTEMAALREQLEMQQEAATSRSGILYSLGQGRRRKISWLNWTIEIAWNASIAVARHIMVNMILLAAISIFMKYRGIPLERLEHIASSWIRRVQHLAFVRRLGRITEHQARSLGIRSGRHHSSQARGSS